LWNIDSTIIREIDDFETILKILSSGKLKNDIIWQVMHDWMSVDTFNRLTHFKQFFKDWTTNHDSLLKNEVFSMWLNIFYCRLKKTNHLNSYLLLSRFHYQKLLLILLQKTQNSYFFALTSMDQLNSTTTSTKVGIHHQYH
ncbi:hypothetical protein TYRP_017577, partial [Tyrophagus putrescentiae]